MLAAVGRGDFRYVVAVDLDRLLRGQADMLALIESGARVVTVDGEIDLATADGEFRATMTAALARFEGRRMSKRQKRANAHRVTQGKPVPGRRRYGYETDAIRSTSILIQLSRSECGIGNRERLPGKQEREGEGGSLKTLIRMLIAAPAFPSSSIPPLEGSVGRDSP